MNQTGTPNIRKGTIPPQSNSTFVKFKVTVYDNAGNFVVNEGESSLYVYNVLIPEFPLSIVSTLLATAALSIMLLYHRKKRARSSQGLSYLSLMSNLKNVIDSR
jgi:hypothetical protein